MQTKASHATVGTARVFLAGSRKPHREIKDIGELEMNECMQELCGEAWGIVVTPDVMFAKWEIIKPTEGSPTVGNKRNGRWELRAEKTSSKSGWSNYLKRADTLFA